MLSRIKNIAALGLAMSCIGLLLMAQAIEEAVTSATTRRTQFEVIPKKEKK